MKLKKICTNGFALLHIGANDSEIGKLKDEQYTYTAPIPIPNTKRGKFKRSTKGNKK